jgi:hypothetical protein
MADNDLPAPTPAPAPAPTPAAPEPAPKPADATPANPTNPLDDLTDDEKKYLAGQKIEGLDLSKGPDAIRKIINHAQASQKQLSKLNDQFQKAGLRLEPDAPANPFGQPAVPSQPQPDGTPTPAPSQDGSIDQATAFTLSTSLATSFPELKDDLVSGKFYKDMQTLGIPIKVGGQVNLDGILKYGALAQQQAQVAAKLEELNKPGEGAIPDANPTTPAQPAADAPMTKQIALAIGAHVAKGGTHARSEEAKQFLQSNIGK